MNTYIRLNVIGNKQVNAGVSIETYIREVQISNRGCPEILRSLHSVFSVNDRVPHSKRNRLPNSYLIITRVHIQVKFDVI